LAEEQRLSAARRPAFDMLTHSPEQTRSVGQLLGRLLQRGDVVLLSGDIGAGKTTFVQGVARALHVGDYVQSPTFTIVAEHAGSTAAGVPVRLYHVDLYRLGGVGDLETIGFSDYLDDPEGVTVVEWPERASEAMPADYLLVELGYVADTKRNLRLIPRGSHYSATVDRFRAEVAGVRG
jgi:tRNA threonylcarbamoyladenosine biosynthesis protein TsaE